MSHQGSNFNEVLIWHGAWRHINRCPRRRRSGGKRACWSIEEDPLLSRRGDCSSGETASAARIRTRSVSVLAGLSSRRAERRACDLRFPVARLVRLRSLFRLPARGVIAASRDPEKRVEAGIKTRRGVSKIGMEVRSNTHRVVPAEPSNRYDLRYCNP